MKQFCVLTTRVSLKAKRLQEMRWSITSGYTPGAIGKITQLHAQYYESLAGFGIAFESRVALELAIFCERYDPAQDILLLLRDADNHEVHGSLAIDGIHGPTQGAQLRWFITSECSRGQGLGRLMLAKAMNFCLQQGYPRIQLSTFEGLNAARHLYEDAGFQLIHQAPGRQWGVEVNEQVFEFSPSFA